MDFQKPTKIQKKISESQKDTCGEDADNKKHVGEGGNFVLYYNTVQCSTTKYSAVLQYCNTAVLQRCHGKYEGWPKGALY